MKKSDIEKYRQVLVAKLEQHLGSAKRKVRAATARIDSRAIDDIAQAENDRELLSRGAASDNKVAAAIARAIARIDHGTYGICLGCEEEMPKKRLDAVPWAALCVPCKDQEGNGKK